jgi:hypothetical protein
VDGAMNLHMRAFFYAFQWYQMGMGMAYAMVPLILVFLTSYLLMGYWACGMRPGSILPTSPERRSPLPRPRLPLGILPSVVGKGANRGRKEPVCPEGPQNGLSSLAEGLKMPLPASIPEFHRLPLKRHPAQTPAIGSGISLTPNSPLVIF